MTNAGGSGCSAEAQPLYTNAPFGIALAHNGNLTNTEELAVTMMQERRHINTNSDSGTSQPDQLTSFEIMTFEKLLHYLIFTGHCRTELLLNVFAEELQRRKLQKVAHDDVFDVVRSVMRSCKGG